VTLPVPAARHLWLRPARRAVVCTMACLAAGPALASTPQAWSAYDAEVLRACVAASSLRGTHAAGQRVDFDDAIGYSALLLAGTYPQAHMKNQSGRELCLFNRRTRTAAVSEADGLLERRATAPAPPGESSPKPQ
jgi:hypothetical protein